MIGVADTCFLIDWARFSQRDLLFELFEFMLVPEQVLAEVRSESTLLWLSRQLGRRRLQLFTPLPRQLEEAYRIVRASYAIHGLRRLDLPEALCLVVGREHGYVVLTENRGALMVREVLPELSDVVIWRALEILRELLLRQHVSARSEEEVRAFFRRYEEETLHIFPRDELEAVVEEVLRSARGRGA